MSRALHELNEHDIAHGMLDASTMGCPLYERLGFRRLFAVSEWSGGSSLACIDSTQLTLHHLPAVSAYDRPLFGADRSRVLLGGRCPRIHNGPP
jgi:hypothetical protein